MISNKITFFVITFWRKTILQRKHHQSTQNFAGNRLVVLLYENNVSGKSYKHKTLFGGNIFFEIFCSILPNTSDRPIVHISQSLYLFCVK